LRTAKAKRSTICRNGFARKSWAAKNGRLAASKTPNLPFSKTRNFPLTKMCRSEQPTTERNHNL